MTSNDNNNGPRHVYKSSASPQDEAPQQGGARPPEPTGNPGTGDSPAAPRRSAVPSSFAAKGPRPPKKPGGEGGFPFGLSKNQFILGITAIGLVVVLLVALLLSVFVFDLFGGGDPSLSGSLSYAPSSSSEFFDPNYDKDANTIPVEQFMGTIIEETAEAGEAYVANTLFIGDSNTERMLSYRDITGVSLKNGIGIANMGITSVTGLQCVKFKGMNACTIPEALKVMQPQRIVINFGTNNYSMGTAAFIDAYRTALNAMTDAWPHADVIIGSIFPIAQRNTYGGISQAKIDEMNLALVELAKELDLKFLNWSEALRDSTGYCKAEYMLGDGVHVNQAGMEALFSYLRTHAYETDDRRPTPVNTSWVREGTPEGLFPKPETSSTTVSSTDSSSSSASSATSAGTVTVKFAAGAGGTLSGTTTFTLAPGATTGQVTATASAGYTFTGWTVNNSQISTAATLAYTVPATTANGSTITVTAVFASNNIEVPNVVGQAYTAGMTANGWTVVQSGTAYHDTIAAGCIISQNPSGSVVNTTPKTIQVVVSLGAQQVTYNVPNVLTGEDTTGWNVVYQDDYTGSQSPGTVLQSPAAGTPVTEKGTITVTTYHAPPETSSSSSSSAVQGDET